MAMKLRAVIVVFSSGLSAKLFYSSNISSSFFLTFLVLCLASCCNRGNGNGNGNGNGGGPSSSTCESSLSGTCLALLSGGKCSKDLCGSFQQV